MKRRILIVSFKRTGSFEKLQSIVQSQAQWIRITELDSTWLIATIETPTQFYNRLDPFLDKNNDRIFIAEMGDNYAGWLSRTIWEWIKNIKT
jgi:hypothetical protein